MKKDDFILQDGKVLSPFPIYPREVRNEQTSLGGLKNTELSTMQIDLADFAQGEILIRIFEKKLKQLAKSHS